MRFSRMHLTLVLSLYGSVATAQWVQTNGPFGGSASPVYSDGQRLFAAVDRTICVSTDQGASWSTWSRDFPMDVDVYGFALKGSRLFVGTSRGIYCTSDNGATWHARNTGLQVFPNTQSPPGVKYFLIPSGSDQNEIFAGAGPFGLYRSTDDGANWLYVDVGLPDPRKNNATISLSVNGLVQIGNFLFAAISHAICRSTDNGRHWNPLPFDFMGYVTALTAHDSILFAGTEGYAASSYVNSLYRSSDYGEHWTFVNSPPFYAQCDIPVNTMISCSGRIFAAGFKGLFRSSDAGEHWAKVGIDLPNLREWYTRSFAFIDSTLFAGTSKGVYLSTDWGTRWVRSDHGLVHSHIQSFAVTTRKTTAPRLFAGTLESGIHEYTPGNQEWIRTGSPAGYPEVATDSIYTIAAGDTVLYQACYSSIFRSFDHGATWRPSFFGETGPLYSLAAIGRHVFAGTSTRAFRSSDQGSSWTPISVELHGYHNLALSDTNVLAGNAASLFRSKDYGVTWKMVLDNRSVEYLAADGPNIFVGSRPISSWSTDGGEHWTDVKTDFQDDYYMIAVHGTDVFLSTQTSGVLFLSRDRARWININPGLPPTDLVTSCGFVGKDVMVGTVHSGAWRRPLSEMIEPQNQNLVKNPGFESGKEPWQMYTDGVGDFSTDLPGVSSPHSARVSIAAPGLNVQLYQSDIPLRARTNYRLSFRAYSNGGDRLSVFLHRHTAPFTSYGVEDWSCDLTKQWSTFMTEFTTRNITDSVTDARLRFWFAPYAKAGDEYFIDDVELVEVEPHLITNGDFEWKTNGWEFFTDGSGSFDIGTDANASNHTAYVKIGVPGSNMQLFQPGILLVEGARYRLSFRACSSSGHSVSVYLHKHGIPYSDYGLEWLSLPLTTSGQTFIKEFTATGFTGGVRDGRLRFCLSPFAVESDEYYFDDVNLERVDGWGGSELVASTESKEKEPPKQFALFQNYPNPFNPVTRIEYTVGMASGIWQVASVRLVVYDLLGREVAVLVDEKKAPGSYEVRFDASGQPSGVYFYRLTAGSVVMTKKILLLK